uniref:Uncharacterized protein n=1 Tax=Tanacetum cinerariifolium TaxID=118510 RepID=A0A6L2KV00_TANCI|nr:hypothetical protein [Tanacetum cinerariifolium]
MRPRPSLSKLKGSSLRGLIRISAMLSSKEIFSMDIFPFWTLSRRKWCWISICLVRECRTGFFTLVNDTYSDSVVDMVRAVCFLENYDARQHPMDVKTTLVLSYDELKSRRVSERAFMSLFGQDNETFTSTMFLNLDQLQRQLDIDEFKEDKSMATFWLIDNQIKVTQFRETLLQHMGNVKKSVTERSHHQRQYERRVNNKQMQTQESKIYSDNALDVVSSQALDADLVVMESNRAESGINDTSSNSGNFITYVVDANIRPVNDQVPFVEVQLTAQHNVLANDITPHYVPKVREFVFVKPYHVIASGSSRNSSNESYGSNDMAHKYYLKVVKKKTQDKNMSLKPSVRHTTSLQNTTNGSKPKPRSKNQTSRSFPIPKSSCGMSNGVPLVAHSRNLSSFSDSKHFICSTCQKCVFNANHDDCITKFLKKVNSRAKVQSSNTRNINKLIEPKSHTQKPDRQIAIGQRFSLNKSSVVREKPNTPRSCLRWIPMGRIFKTVGLRWIPTGNMFTDSTTKVDSEPSNAGSHSSTTIDQDVPSASTSLTTQEIQSQVTHQGAKEQIHGHQNAQFDNAPLLHTLSSYPSSKETTLQGFIPSNLHHLNQSFDTLTKLTMNHPLENVICDHSRSVLTRSQLQGHIFGLYTSSLLNTACKKALNLLKKGLSIRGEAVEASKRKRSLLDHKIQLLSKGSSEGSGIIPEVAVCSSLQSLKPKCTIESRAKRSSNRTLFHYACFVIHYENEDGNPARANIKQALGR